MRAVRGLPVTVTASFVDGEGRAVEVIAPVAVSVVDGDGVSVTTGTATEDGGVWSFVWTPADALDYDTFRVTFTKAPYRAVVDVRLVSAHYVTLAQARADVNLSDETRFPDSTLIAARDRASTRFEQAAMVSHPIQGARERAIRRRYPASLFLPLGWPYGREVYSVTVDDTDLDLTGYTVTTEGLIWAPSAVWDGDRIVVHYAHGKDEMPEPVSNAVLTLMGEYAVPSNLPGRATVQSTDAGSFRLSIAGRDGFTGIPEVDEVAREFGCIIPVVGSAGL